MRSIKIKVRHSLINKTTKEEEQFLTKGILNKNKLTYQQEDVTYLIIIKNQEILLNRENNDFQNSLIFKKNKTTISNYLVKENSLTLEINIKTTKLEITKDLIIIEYTVLDSNNDYLFKIEMEEVT